MILLNKALVALDVDLGEAVTALNKQTAIFLNVFAGVGVLLICFGVFNFLTSIESHDNAQKVRAYLMVAAGCVLVAIKAFMTYIMPAGTMDGI